MAELLLELFSEEIPARMQARAAEDLKRLVGEELKQAGLAFTRAEAFVTPRRLALVVDGLPERQPDRKDERKGPRVGAPEQAIAGFLKANGLTSLDQCETRVVGKAEFHFAVIDQKGRATREVIQDFLGRLVWRFPWPKSMRWAASRARWVRPLHAIVVLFDGRPVEGSIDFEGAIRVAFGDTTRGHRFLSPAPFKVTGFEDYKAKLRAAHVILDPVERRGAIARDAEVVASQLGLVIKDDPALLDEVTGLVEWPVVLSGAIDPAFMDLPPEVLTTSMRAHQKYFALQDATGALAPRFLVVANMLAEDGGAAIVRGNERVLRARLADAKFFWDQDRKTRLEDRVPALATRVFHAKLGTLAEKVARIQALAADLAPSIPDCDKDRARAAALLAKADLSAGMVGEFPELQGVMGRYYALAEGESADVAEAIREHYAPLGLHDRCPTAPVSVAVALADKIDTLVGFFAIDEKPTGSKDPFALRRAALGVIRLIVENGLRMALRPVFVEACALHGPRVKAARPAECANELLAFLADRLKVALREKGVRHDLIDAVFALGGEDDLVRLLARVDALRGFLASDDGANLLTGYRRAANIVAIEQKKDSKTYDGALDPLLLKQPEEATLSDRLASARRGAGQALRDEDFVGAMRVVSGLRGPIDAFFDKVTVNDLEPTVRANRLRLLAQIRATLGTVADFARIEG